MARVFLTLLPMWGRKMGFRVSRVSRCYLIILKQDAQNTLHNFKVIPEDEVGWSAIGETYQKRLTSQIVNTLNAQEIPSHNMQTLQAQNVHISKTSATNRGNPPNDRKARTQAQVDVDWCQIPPKPLSYPPIREDRNPLSWTGPINSK